ncbi:helix-turn-helix domain-containing protein [Mesonia maritima]
MIFELAKGNFSHRIPIEHHEDTIQDFEILLNLLAEELGDFFVYSGSFNERNITGPFVFVLNESFEICGTNRYFQELLGYPQEKLLHQALAKHMTTGAYRQLQEQIGTHLNATSPQNSLKTLLCFQTQEKHSLSCWSFCHRLWDGEDAYYFFRGLPIAYEHESPLSPVAKDPAASYTNIQLQADFQKIRAVHQFVLENLHCKLPPLHNLARKFHLNEFKLKTGFKELYQTTVFKLHLEKRLEMAMLMIKFTPTSLKVVAHNHGFKSASHFSRAFKKKYGKPPSYFKHK